ncbi:hypothetical protein DEO72_LG8g1958 [Vigna unguiculata]|uniref:Uncharacterized protein n=1 Tax=Vigna unguiculata TaxID=3917 RepID=A0A4D6MR07_VIGUN|nr:hypothetical protein DEO72_LG8g1958 [Vigna unguiculata]
MQQQERARREEQGAFTFSRLGETSSPARDELSLKIGARRLSDSSCKFQGATSGALAWARLARLGEHTRVLHCSRMQQQERARREEQGAFTFSRLGETSSPERDELSLKIGARRLSDSSCKFQGATSGALAWARLARLGEHTRVLHCSRMQQQTTSTSKRMSPIAPRADSQIGKMVAHIQYRLPM